jgi:hypothetical protein
MSDDGRVGVGSWFYVILQNMLICLKLLDLVTYSWWKVFTPSFVLAGILLFAVVATAMIAVNKGDVDE